MILNLLFLLSIIVLPATNGLYGSYQSSSVVAVIYGGHLSVIGALNALLWFVALKGHGHPAVLAISVFTVLVFVLGTVVAVFAPAAAAYCWSLAFAAPLLGRLRPGRSSEA